MRKALLSLGIALLVAALAGWFVNRNGAYRVLRFTDSDVSSNSIAVATVQPVNLLNFPRGKELQIECYGSLDKATNLSEPGYRTSPDKPATWEGAVGTKHWMHRGCRPLPIGFTVRFAREKYPANYFDYDSMQETGTDTWFGHSYWKIDSEQ